MIATKVFVSVCLFAVGTYGAPQYNQPFQFGRPAYPTATGVFVPILSQHYDLNPDGSYSFGYKSGDGSSRDETGVVKNRGGANEAMYVQGAFNYNSPAGPVGVSYVADENGYQPTGSNIHPAIIQAVAEQVAEARANPQGQYQGTYRQY